MIEGTFTSFDNAAIFYRAWNYKEGQKTMIVLHRGHEHSARLAEFAQSAPFANYNVFSFDFRGHGYTEQEVSPNFMDYVRDLDAFAHYLNQTYQIHYHDTFVVANSIAGVIASAWVHDYAVPIAGMALLAPAFSIKLYVPLAKEMIALGTKFKPDMIVTSYVKSKVLTHEKDQQVAYDSDPLITKFINGRMLVDLLDAGKRIVDDAAAITVPTIVFSAGKDYVVKNKWQQRFFHNLSSDLREFKTLKESFHGILFEKGREQVYKDIAKFMEKSFAAPKVKINLKADKFTTDEYYQMLFGLLPSVELLSYKIQKKLLGVIGPLSEGMRLGLLYGFDSGISLDYVYKNTPQGKLGFGKIMDKNYLNAIGWAGIRQRKIHLLQQIDKQIALLQEQGQPIKILDVAGGTGNYLFDIKAKYPEAEIVVNDFKRSNIEVGEAYIKQHNLSGIRFTNYDCFDLNTYPLFNFEPNITIISGIFELFDDNDTICNTIKGISSIATNNSVIVYTGQPWHPQLKTIAFVLKSHRDTDWVMRRRSQYELDKLFAYNSVFKQNMLIDNYGIFTVSVGKIVKS